MCRLLPVPPVRESQRTTSTADTHVIQFAPCHCCRTMQHGSSPKRSVCVGLYELRALHVLSRAPDGSQVMEPIYGGIVGNRGEQSRLGAFSTQPDFALSARLCLVHPFEHLSGRYCPCLHCFR